MFVRPTCADRIWSAVQMWSVSALIPVVKRNANKHFCFVNISFELAKKTNKGRSVIVSAWACEEECEMIWALMGNHAVAVSSLEQRNSLYAVCERRGSECVFLWYPPKQGVRHLLRLSKTVHSFIFKSSISAVNSVGELFSTLLTLDSKHLVGASKSNKGRYLLMPEQEACRWKP